MSLGPFDVHDVSARKQPRPLAARSCSPRECFLAPSNIMWSKRARRRARQLDPCVTLLLYRCCILLHAKTSEGLLLVLLRRFLEAVECCSREKISVYKMVNKWISKSKMVADPLVLSCLATVRRGTVLHDRLGRRDWWYLGRVLAATNWLFTLSFAHTPSQVGTHEV